ncbi:MAG: DUF916 domain-containing protein [Catenulispora sp.]|nr:DUF916 domain-containing protein [Catenulispora sp.]
MRRWSALLAALFMACAAFLVAPAQPAAAAGNGEWSIDPLVPDGTSQNTRRYFFLEGAPGTTIQDSAVVANTSTRAISFVIFGSDATNTPRDGGFALDRAEDPKDEVGSWIQIPEAQRKLTLQPGERVQVPFAIQIPANAKPGDHIGGVVALNTAIEGTPQQGDIQINIQRQIGARVYLRVAGDIVPGMTVENVRVQRDTGFGAFFGSGDAEIRYTIVNRGNIIVRPKIDIEASGLFGRSLMSKKAKDEYTFELMPGQQVELKQTWKGAPRLDRVSVKVKATTEVSVQSQANPNAAPQTLTDSASVSYTAVPWPALTVLAVILIAAGFGWQYFRRRGKGDGGTGKPSGDDPKPSSDAVEEPKAADQPQAKKTAPVKATSAAPAAPAAPAEAPKVDAKAAAKAVAKVDAEAAAKKTDTKTEAKTEAKAEKAAEEAAESLAADTSAPKSSTADKPAEDAPAEREREQAPDPTGVGS